MGEAVAAGASSTKRAKERPLLASELAELRDRIGSNCASRYRPKRSVVSGRPRPQRSGDRCGR